MSEISRDIESIRREMGDELFILGHHYQRPAVLDHADAIGDSLELSKMAAAEKDARRIAFCGVHFMAESADILTSADQQVFMPEPGAGCPMASMATDEQMTEAWKSLNDRVSDGWLPVVYVNSTAAIKALCGEWGGSTCTSSNSAKIFDWVLSQDKRIFFLPDEHLGVNTAADLGLPSEQIAVYDPRQEDGGLTDDEVTNARIVAWKGFCNVHTAFSPDHVAAVRENWPEATIIVHPETPREVLKLCDEHGSTSQIIKYIEGLPEGAMVFVGTEFNLVNRMAETHRGRVEVRALSQSLCANMYMTTDESLLHLLRNWPDTHRISVPEDIAGLARTALERMLNI